MSETKVPSPSVPPAPRPLASTPTPRPARQPVSRPTIQAATSQAPSRVFSFRPGESSAKLIGHRVLLYGTGGIGKTTIACHAPGPVAFIDTEDSLPRLRSQLEESGVWGNVGIVRGIFDFASLRECLQSNALDSSKTIVLDTATRIEEWATAWVVENVTHEKGHKVKRIEDYGYGKGYRHVFDAWLGLLADLDRHASDGRNVILLAHDVVAEVPNAAGVNWKRNEPRLQKQDNGSIRLRSKEWTDHVMYMGYDLVVDTDTQVGKSQGTVTIYCQEQPFCMAKTRSRSTMFYRDQVAADMWAELFATD